MSFKKFFLIAILLLTIITIGSVSASDDFSSQNLTVDETAHESLDLSSVENEIVADDEDDYGDYYYVNIPSTIEYTYEDDTVVNYGFYEDVQGEVTVTWDGEVIYDQPAGEGYHSVEWNTEQYDYGIYDVAFSYVSSDGIHDSFTKTEQVEITYPFWASVEDEEYNKWFCGEDLFVNIRTPVYEGTVLYTVNGKSYSVDVENFTYSDDYDYDGIFISNDDFKLGNNNLIFKYVNPDFPEKTYLLDLDINPYISISESDISWDEATYVSLIMPKDAKGSLKVYIDDNFFKSTPVSNGIANITIKDLSIGDHNIQAEYTGSDYDVEPVSYGYISVLPKITVPEKIYKYDDYSLLFELPENFNGEVTLTVADESKSKKLVNGKAAIDLFNIESASSEEDEIPYITAYVEYCDDSGYEYSSSYRIFVSENNPDFEVNFTSSKEVIRQYDHFYEVSYYLANLQLPEDANGNVEIYIDGKLYEVDLYYELSAAINVDNLTLGKHDVELKYSGDSYYLPKSVSTSFEVTDLIIDIPQYCEINGNYNDVDIYFNKYVSGNFTVLVDGKIAKEFIITPAYYGDSFWFDLYNLDLKTHKIEVRYSGDSNHKPLSKSADVKVNYTIGLDIYNEGYIYGDGEIRIDLPEDATSNMTVKIDGKQVGYAYVDYVGYYVDISDVSLGNHKIEVTYPGDKKYPALTVSKDFTVAPQIRISYGQYNSGENYVYLKLPSNAKGNLIVNVDGNEFVKVKLNNGVANVSLDSLKLGDFKVSARYDGNDYDVECRYDDIHISPMIILGDYYLINESGYIYFELPNDAKGNLIVNIDGNQYAKQKLENGKVNVTLNGLKLGNHNVTAFYDGDDYIVDEISDEFYSYPLDEDYPYHVGDTIFVQLPADAKGNLVILLDGKQIDKVKFVNGYASSVVPKLPNGWNNNLTVRYDGDDYGPVDLFEGGYLIKAKVRLFDGISKKDVQLYPISGATPRQNINVSVSDKVIVELPDKFNGEFTATLDYLFLAKGKFNNGVGEFDLSNAKLGLQHLYIDYEYEKDKHDFVSFYVNVKKSPELSISAGNITEGEVAIVNVTADNSVTGNVLVNINNTNYTVSLVDGKGSLSVSNLDVGSYEITAYFSDTNDFGHQGAVSSFAVAKKVYEPVIKASDVSMQYGDGSKFTVTVYGTDGNVAPNQTVVIKIAGKKVATLNTDSKGKVSYKITSVPKTYKISATALGKTVTKKLTVKQILSIKTGTVKKSAKKLVLTATLKKVKGKYLKNKKITFKFNGKKYTAKTNSKGVAKVTIKKAVLKKLKVGKKVTYQATYLKDTVKKTVKVLK